MQHPLQSRPPQEARGRPGTPSLLRELNDRAALDLLLRGETLTRSQISEHTGVSRVTVSQMLARLEERGLVMIVGEQAGNRGPNAALYSVVPSSAYVAGLYMESDLVSAAVADVTGRRVADVSVDPNGADGPVEVVRGVIERACASAGVELARLSALVIGPSSAGHRAAGRRPTAMGNFYTERIVPRAAANPARSAGHISVTADQ